jgi:hypothetical protein
VNGMSIRIRGITQRDDPDIQSAPFEGQDFLGNKSLREAGVSFEDEGDRRHGVS